LKKLFYFAILILILMTSCNNKTSENYITDFPDINYPDITENVESPLPELDLSPVFSIDSYNDVMIHVAYTKPLPDNVEVLFNSENATVFKFSSTAPYEGFYPDKVIEIKNGVRNGKILFKKITSGDGEGWNYGFMNADFSLLNDEIYLFARSFEDGHAIVQKESGFGVIDTNGDYVIPCVHDYLPELYKNIIKVPYSLSFNEKYYNCFNRKNGDFLYSIKTIEDQETGSIRYYRIVDPENEIEILDISEFADNTLVPYKDNQSRKYGYRNGFGEVVISPEYTFAYDFSDGLARVLKENKYGFINNLGEVIIPFVYDSAGSFNSGAAMVSLGNEEFMLNTEGEIIDTYDFKVYKGFHDRVAAVVMSESTKWQYVDINGELLFNYTYSSAGNFSHGFAPVVSSKRIDDPHMSQYYYIDKTGSPAFGPLVFINATELNPEGYAMAWDIGSVFISDEYGERYETAFNYYVIQSHLP